MCGIVGLISRYGDFSYYAENLFTNLLRMDSIRGPDSTGVFGITGQGHVDWLKGDTDGWTFTQSANYGKFEKRITNYRIVVGHNRKATSGSIKADNAHPFKEKHIIMVHNGSVDTKDLTSKTTEVDSHAITHALADHNAVEALGKLNGAYALVWYDSKDKTLNLARNKERPLSLVEYDGTWVISSEIGLPLWLQARENRRSKTQITVPTDKILVFNLKDLSKGFYEVPYEEYKSWRAPVVLQTYPQQEKKTEFKPAGSHSPVAALFRHSPEAHKKPVSEVIKAGDTVIFQLADSKVESGSEVLIGHPIFDGEKDENILVRTVLEKNDDPFRYFDIGNSKEKPNYVGNIKTWKGVVQFIRLIGNVQCIFINKMAPVLVVNDAQGASLDKDEASEAIKKGCTKCQGAMVEADIPTGIVRKKKDGGWRIVCPKCLEESIRVAHENNPNIGILRARALS